MPNPVTDTGNQITANHSWYIWTISSYYAANAGNPRDFSSDRTSINATIFSSTDGLSAEVGTNQGIKMIFGPTDKDPSSTCVSVPHVNGSANYLWKPVGQESNTTGSYYGDGRDYFMHSYSYGATGVSLVTSGSGFGPYELNLTPIATGSVMLIATGSDVLIGNTLGGDNNNKDTRAYNVLFWVTGSANAAELVYKITGTAPGPWNNDDRKSIYNAGYGLFQTHYDDTNGTLTWYPGNYDDNDIRDIYSWPG
jgi:hypothetical protein